MIYVKLTYFSFIVLYKLLTLLFIFFKTEVSSSQYFYFWEDIAFISEGSLTELKTGTYVIEIFSLYKKNSI